ncbi:MAG: sugar phosphate nucleotidyltransferase [Armatimonadota bacterium]
MQVAVLVGGKGTRLFGSASPVPKALIEIGGRPILWHIMRLYAHYGVTDFVLCLGHLGDMIRRAFGPSPEQGDPLPLATQGRAWSIAFAETGDDTPTGGRVKLAEPHLGDDVFMVTYGDGLADLDIRRLAEFHRQHGRMATVTAVRARAQFGVMRLRADGSVSHFEEKPWLPDVVNGGFYVFNREILEELAPEHVLERDVLPVLAERGELVAFEHDGFWACLDTYKDALSLNDQWDAGQAPWKAWPE